MTTAKSSSSDIFQSIRADDSTALVKFLQEKSSKFLTDESEDEGNTVTPLMLSAKLGKFDSLNLLIRAGASVNQQDSQSGKAALHWAARKGFGSVTQSLLEAGANIDLQTMDGETALMMAAPSSDTSTVNILLNAGARANLLDKQGCSAVAYATDPALKKQLQLHFDQSPPDFTLARMLNLTKADDTPSAGEKADASQYVEPASHSLIQRVQEMQRQCSELSEQLSDAPRCLALQQRLGEVRAEQAAAKELGKDADMDKITALGMEVSMLEQEVKHLPLTHEQCLALTERRAELVQAVVELCQVLQAAGMFEEMKQLAEMLRRLKTNETETEQRS
mmetsp:Transcript_45989/g.91134  ORF Transcript_45989/g.91134 Transcript_45989/m.91134 type:complete len:335 (+) Transcript_45989:35-1039(+)|eukprot:CAMPEP_0170390056 /NCGR_PEP_ID=MMETSP0117_2-20130122/18941_1 /TAXON_ID=400756 /ORGANISM="Durinskia baltica, Strain CSIRO CS-38" /LENGTH=334 /DNA_ID=CAMNT_0010646073 /DNA_START=35 /DNA_END=1039 /DNA_ORIENTATION=+